MQRTPCSLPLDREQITAAALALLKEGGLKNLSTRRLGQELGIKSASLYHHFRDKRQLLDYVAAAMLRPAWRAQQPGEAWQDWIIAIAAAQRRQLHAYPDGALVAAGTSPPPDFAADSVALLFEPVLRAGFPPEEARDVLFTVLRFTWGWAADEQIARGRGTERPAALSSEGFDYGLRIIVSGCEARLKVLKARRRQRAA